VIFPFDVNLTALTKFKKSDANESDLLLSRQVY
jgi:hypothetical protein